jgi:hypothetical protein
LIYFLFVDFLFVIIKSRQDCSSNNTTEQWVLYSLSDYLLILIKMYKRRGCSKRCYDARCHSISGILSLLFFWLFVTDFSF